MQFRQRLHVSSFPHATALIPALALIFAALAVAPAPAAMQQTDDARPMTDAVKDLPTADEIIARYVKALGGEENIRKVTSQTATGTIQIPGTGMDGTFTVKVATPMRMLMKMTFAGMGEMLVGFDGEVGWRSDMMSGQMLMTDDEIAQFKTDADLHLPLNMAKHFPTRELVGRTEIEGIDAYELRFVRESGHEMTMFFHTENGLLLGHAATAETQMGPIQVRTYLSDYRDVDGQKVPMSSIVRQGPIQLNMRTDSVEFNTVEDEDFSLPPAIKRLIEVREQERQREAESEDAPQ